MSNITTIDAQCRALIAEQLGKPIEEVTDVADFTKDLGGDSLDQVELCLMLEEEFDLDEISADDSEKLTNARAVIDYVTKAREAV